MRGLAGVTVLLLAACGSSADSSQPGSTDASEATAAPEAPETTSTTVDPALACIARMPIRQRIAQTLAIAIDAGSLDSEAQRAADLQVGGVLLQRVAGGDLTGGIATVKERSAIPPLVMVDEEGGASQELRPVLGPFPSEPSVVASGDPAAAQAEVAAHAQEVAALGVDMVLGPVVDVTTPGGGGPLAGRAFSDDPSQVAAYGQAYVAGWLEAGLIPVLKHFPGHGSASGDSHDGPVEAPLIDQLRARDLVPYEQLLAQPGVAVMMAHVVVPDLTGFAPASQSPEAIDGLLRDEMGFDGLVVTDSLSMGAVAFRAPPEQSFPAALAAGADIALFVTIADPAAAITAGEQAVADGHLTEARVNEAVARVLAAKEIDPCTVAPPA